MATKTTKAEVVEEVPATPDNPTDITEAPTEAVPEEGNTEEVVTPPESVGTEEITTNYGLGEGQVEEVKPGEKVDYKARWEGSQKEYEKKYKPMEEAITELDGILRDNPVLAQQLRTAADAKKQMQANPYNQNVELTQRLDQIENSVKKASQVQEQQALDQRVEVLQKFDLQYGKNLNAEQKSKLGKTANALFKEGIYQDYGKALEQAHNLHNPKHLIEKGKNEAYLSQAKTEKASFSQQTSDTGKKPSGVEYSQKELNTAKKLDPTGKLHKAMVDKM